MILYWWMKWLTSIRRTHCSKWSLYCLKLLSTQRLVAEIELKKKQKKRINGFIISYIVIFGWHKNVLILTGVFFVLFGRELKWSWVLWHVHMLALGSSDFNEVATVDLGSFLSANFIFGWNNFYRRTNESVRA